MENHKETTTGAGNSAAQILNNLTLAQAYAHAATADKAAYIVELLGVKSIHSPLFVELEDAIEERFHQLRVADNRKEWYKVSAVRKPVPFYYGEKAKPTLLQHIDNLEKQLLNAREMLATIEQDGWSRSGLACLYRSRANELSEKIERLRKDVPLVYFS